MKKTTVHICFLKSLQKQKEDTNRTMKCLQTVIWREKESEMEGKKKIGNCVFQTNVGRHEKFFQG